MEEEVGSALRDETILGGEDDLSAKMELVLEQVSDMVLDSLALCPKHVKGGYPLALTLQVMMQLFAKGVDHDQLTCFGCHQ